MTTNPFLDERNSMLVTENFCISQNVKTYPLIDTFIQDLNKQNSVKRPPSSPPFEHQ